MINFLRNFKVNVRIWTLTILAFIGMVFIVWEFSTLVDELQAGSVSQAQFESHQNLVYQ